MTTSSPVFCAIDRSDLDGALALCRSLAGAVRSASRLGIAMLTVHAAGGAAMLRAARDAARESARPPAILGVNVLTSLDDDDLRTTGVSDGVERQVLRLADLALEAGCDGLVCSPREIASLRARFGPDALLVVPGIRTGPEVQDQRRT